MIDWISTTDRLPETDEKVICLTLTKKGARNIIFGYYSDGMWRCGMNANVTHWLPLTALPELPK